ncbi:MAG: alpha/beta fold hydrolase [Anaerolineaceae bacterium]
MPVCAGLYFTEYKPQKSSVFNDGYLLRPVIVLLHGAGGSQLSWPVEIRRLSGYRVLALDLPGHGKSSGIASQNMEDNNRAVTAFLRKLGVFSVVLVGHSLGAAIAVDFARNNPDQVKALALLSAAVRFTIPSEIFQAVADAETYPIALSIIRQRFFSPRTPASIRDRIMIPLEKQRSTIFYSDFLAAAGVDLRKRPSLITCPSWIASGRQDLIIPPSVSRDIESLFLNAEFSEIPAAGHMLPLEQPASVASGLQRFLGRHNHFIKDEIEKDELYPMICSKIFL